MKKLEEYDILDCPYCDKPCNPVKEKANGVVVYQKHTCSFGGGTSEFQFSIDVNGDLIE